MGTVRTEEMENLLKQFSELGTQFAFQMCMNFVEKVKEEYPKVPKDDFLNLARRTFEESNIRVDTKIPTPRPKVKDEDKCAKILPTGKNRGKRCSIPKTEGSEYCKRHRNRILTSSSSKDTPLYQKQIKSYLDIIQQPKVYDIKKSTPLKLRQHKNENMYLEADTNIMFRLNDKNEYVAFGIYVEDQQGAKGIAKLSDDEKIICTKNCWEYEE
jgi:hypothetical protein